MDQNVFLPAAGSDYVSVGGVLSVNSNNAASVTLFLNNDDMPEGPANEQFFVDLFMSDDTPCSPGTATIVIQDDDEDDGGSETGMT